ncbi:HAD family hydrolase [Candidatus Thorarchaeota archaeon]|nr:MAG: HAD family hydrolase [Candidatus Thorarchaeota archaeon]
MTFDLVVFDVDGTLTEHNSIWWRLHEVFGTTQDGKKFFDQFFAGEITYQEWADLDAGLWSERSVDEIMAVVHATELVPGAAETVEELKNRGLEVAILSGGLNFLADDIARRVNIDYVLTNELEAKDGVLTGRVRVRVGWGEKVEEIKEILRHFDTEFERTVFVGDGKNDISVLKKVGLAIAFRPESVEVERSAHVVVHEEDLRAILSHIPPH